MRITAGITLVEAVVSVGLVCLITGAWLLGGRQTAVATAGDQVEAAYYTQLGLFLEAFQADARMASRIVPGPDGCEMELLAGGGAPQKIVYAVRPQGIERLHGSRRQLFDFGRAPVKDARLLFRFEEVNP